RRFGGAYAAGYRVASDSRAVYRARITVLPPLPGGERVGVRGETSHVDRLSYASRRPTLPPSPPPSPLPGEGERFLRSHDFTTTEPTLRHRRALCHRVRRAVPADRPAR